MIIICTSFLLITGCAIHSEKEKISTPNILWIVADDLGADLGCYSTPLVKTPNLDKLASEGILYSNLFTVTAVCSPSRSSLITGMYPTSIDCHQHRTHYKDSLPEGVFPITEYFREAGYFVCNGAIADRNIPGKQDYNFIVPEDMYDGTDWTQRKPDQPFFAQIQISGPHRAFKRDPSNPINADSIILPPYYPDHPVARQDWALYLENIQLVDRQVGEILKRLDQDGLSDSTIVFFFGDQGRPHVRAKQFLYDGGIHTPLIIRFPFHSKPGSIDNRLVSNVDIPVTSLRLANIELPDHLQGIDFLADKSDEREAVFSMRDRRDETVDRIRSVRTNRYKYIHNFYPDRPYNQFNAYKKHQYPVLTLMEVMYQKGEMDSVQARFMSREKPAEELYDILSDPFEINNLAEQNDYQEILEELRKKLDDWLFKCDLGTYPEDSMEINYWESYMKQNFAERMKERGLDTVISNEEFLKYWTEYLIPTEKTNDNTD